MIFEGRLREVIAAAQQQKRHIEEYGEPDPHIRLLLVAGGGVMYGCEGGGTVTAFYEAGYDQVFDWVYGASTGAPCVSYFLSGNPRVGTSIYYTECCSSAFISPLRVNRPIDCSYLASVFKGITGKGLRAEQVLSHRTNLLFGLTNATSGRSHVYTPSSPEGLHAALEATVSIPGLTGMPVSVEERLYTDGALSSPLPLRYLIHRYQPTHVIVLPHRTRDLKTGQSIVESLLSGVVYRNRISPQVRLMMARRAARLKQSIDWLRRESPVAWVIAWSRGSINKFERDPEAIELAAKDAEQSWLSKLL